MVATLSLKETQGLQKQGRVSTNVHCSYKKELRHDFIVVPDMVHVVREYCLECIHVVMNDELLSRVAVLSSAIIAVGGRRA